MPGFAVGQAQQSTFADTAPVKFDAPPVPFWGAVQSSFDDQVQTRNTEMREQAVRDLYLQRHAQVEQALGRHIPQSTFMVQAGDDQNTEPADTVMGRLGQTVGLVAPGVRYPSPEEYSRRLDMERGLHPEAFGGVATDQEILAKVNAQLGAVRAKADVASGQHPVAGFLGAMGGSFQDPVNVLSMAAGGGAARTFAGRMLNTAAATGLSEALQVPGRVDVASKVGPAYTPGEGVRDVVSAFLGGAVFHAGSEAAGKLFGIGVRELAKIGAEAPDAGLRGAAHVVGQGIRDDQLLGPLDGLSHETGLDALVKGGPKPQVEPARELGDLFGDTPTPPPSMSQSYDSAAFGITGATEYYGRPILQGTFDPKALGTDAARFQYKADADAAGVTARLRGIDAWDPTASGKVIVFEDAAGRQVIADGHQRLGLAKRLDGAGFDPKLDGFLFRETDGWTARQVRTIGALKNLREGSGTILDAAKVFRDAPEALNDRSLPVTGDFITQARALARLDPEAFGAVINGVIPERYGAEIGAMAHNRPDLHAGLVKLLHQAEPANLDEARGLISEAQLDDWISTQGEQTDMFGGEAPESTVIARARVKTAVLAAIRKDARVYGQLVKHADAIEAGGNVLLRDANETAAAVNRTALEVMQRLSLRSGEVGDAVAAAAREVMAGKRPADAARGLAQMVRNRIASGEALEGLRLETLDPKAPSPAALETVAKLDDIRGSEAQGLAREAPEDAQLADTPGLFEDLAEPGAEERAHARLAACAPGE